MLHCFYKAKHLYNKKGGIKMPQQPLDITPKDFEEAVRKAAPLPSLRKALTKKIAVIET